MGSTPGNGSVLPNPRLVPGTPVGPGPAFPRGGVIYRGNAPRSRGMVGVYNGRSRYHLDSPYACRPPVFRYYRDPNRTYDLLLADLIANRSAREIGSTFLEMDSVDYDLVPIGQCGIHQIMLHVKRNDANVDHLIVVFSDGSQSEMDYNAFYGEGAFSSWRMLPNFEGQCVESVIVVGTSYSNDGTRMQSELEIFGRF
jgi:hypothetical protein